MKTLLYITVNSKPEELSASKTVVREVVNRAFLNQVMSSRSASMIFSFFILLIAYSIVMNTIKSTLNTLIAILFHGNTKSILSAPLAIIPL